MRSRAMSAGSKSRRSGTARRSSPFKRRAKRALAYASMLLLFALLLGFVYSYVLFYRAGQTVENIGEIMSGSANKATLFYSTDGTRLAAFRTAYQDPVALSEVPKNLQNATIAAEDKRFWQHKGVDVVGMSRAAWLMLRGGPKQGASTLAQQLAKRLYTNQERTIGRKMQDIALAIQMERKLTKEQVLELYLNQVYYGCGAYGVKAATDVYFNKKLNKLTLGECALLARLPRRPSRDNPFIDRESAVKNRDTVLDLMLEQGLITSEQCEEAKGENLHLARRRAVSREGWKAPYAVAEALRQLKGVMDVEQLYAGGYRVDLTIDNRMQEAAEDALDRVLRNNRGVGVTDGAAFLMDLQGHIRVMVGGADFNRNQYNVITQGLRQPGSAFKPLMYAVGFESGQLTPDSMVNDSRHTYYPAGGGEPYTPENSNQKYTGWVTVRNALTWSKNCAAVYANAQLGPTFVAQDIQNRFGFTTKIQPVLSLPLGATAVHPIEMAEAFSVFASGGNRVKPYLIDKVTAPDGTVIYRGAPAVVRDVVRPDTASQIDSILRDVVQRGTGTRARSVDGARGKTGTTSEFKDAWFIGYAGNFVGLAWVGSPHFDNAKHEWVYRPMDRVFGGHVPVLVWTEMMHAVDKIPGMAGEAKPASSAAEGYTAVTICKDSGQLATKWCPHTQRQEFVTGTEPTSKCPIHVGPDEGGQVQEKAQPRDNGDSAVNPTERTVSKPKVDESGMVTVWICEESGLPANSYCPDAVPRKFPPDKVPKGVCRIHGP